jgi:hypothetical protein
VPSHFFNPDHPISEESAQAVGQVLAAAWELLDEESHAP